MPMNLFSALRTAARLGDPPLQIGSPWSTPATLETIVWPDLFGLDAVPLTRAEAMSVPAVKRARQIIAGTIARLPLDADPGTLPIWLDRTDEPVSAFHRMLWTVDDLLFYGWSLWRVDRGTTGTIRHAYRVRWD